MLRQFVSSFTGRLMTLLLGLIVLLALFFPVTTSTERAWWPPLVLALASAGGWWGWQRLVNYWTKHPGHHRTWAVGLWGVLLVVQLLIALTCVAAPRADLALVHQQALALINGRTTWGPYFHTYPNNVTLTLLLAGLLKIGRELFGTATGVFLNLVQFGWLDLGLAIMAHHLRRHNPVTANLFVVLATTCIPLYTYGLTTYSDIWVLPVGLIVLVTSQRLRQATTWGRWLVAALTLSLTLTGAILLKANLVVFALAVLLWLWILPAPRRFGRTGVTLLLGLCLLGGNVGVHAGQRAAGFHPATAATLPVTSWIAMSWNPDYSGTYNRADAQAVIHQPTAAGKRRVARQQFRTAIHRLGFKGIVIHLIQKTRRLLATGTFDGFNSNSAFMRLPNWVRNQSPRLRWLLANWAQISYLTLLEVTLVAGLRQWHARRWSAGFLLGSLMTLGLAAFHVIFWETAERYALPLLPLFLTGAAVGLTTPAWQWQFHWPHTWWRRGGVSLIVLVALLQLGLLSTTPINQTVRVVSQNEGRYYQPHFVTLASQQTVTQAFTAPVAFNQLKIDPGHTHLGRLTIRRHGRIIWRFAKTTRLNRCRLPQQPAGHYQLTVTNTQAKPLRLHQAQTTAPLIPGSPAHHLTLRFFVLRPHTAPFISPGVARWLFGSLAVLALLLIWWPKNRLPYNRSKGLK